MKMEDLKMSEIDELAMVTEMQLKILKAPFKEGQRKFLSSVGVLGYDCDGNIIREGDRVVVVTQDPIRMGDPKYDFCSKGKEGIAIRYYAGTDSIIVSFGEDKEVGCKEKNLRKI